MIASEREQVTIDHAAPAVAEADERVTVERALLDHCTDEGIEPGTVAATCEESDSHTGDLTRRQRGASTRRSGRTATMREPWRVIAP